MVSTFAGKLGELGNIDGQGLVARFHALSGLALAADDSLFVSDSGNRSVRRITPGGAVSTVAGGRGYGARNGRGPDAKFGSNFSGTEGLAVMPDGSLLGCDSPNGTIRAISRSGDVTTWSGTDWISQDGVGVGARFSGSGDISVASSGDAYVVDREAHALIRCVGPGRAGFGVSASDLLRDPVLTVRQGSAVLAMNDVWSTEKADVLEESFRMVGSFGLSRNSRDAALLMLLRPGTYTAQVTGGGLSSGEALVEVYEVP